MSNRFAERRLLNTHTALRALLFAFVPLLFAAAPAAAVEPVRAIRIWPAQDYTRITLESSAPIKHELLSVKRPERLVLDIENVDIASVLQELAGKLAADDPYIAGLRAGRFKPGVVRLVLDLKTAVKPQIFILKPVGDYGYRLVLDIYPAVPVDPLMALLEKPQTAPAAEDRKSESVALAKPPALPLPVPAAPGARAAEKKPAVVRLVTVVIDAGHGGEDPGARGRRGSREKNVTLTIAKKLKSIVDAEPNMRAVLTRDGDYFIPLQGRVEKARRVKADLFVSIHADAFVKPHARGSSVFALSERGATSSAAGWLAKKENEADLIGGVNIAVKDRYLAQTLLDLSQTAQISDSLKLGRAVLGELGGVNALHKGKVEQAGFAVLKSPDIPSILVETAFISNPDEERRLNDEAYQTKMAQALFKGIKSYFAKNPPLARPVVTSEARDPSPLRPVVASQATASRLARPALAAYDKQ